MANENKGMMFGADPGADTNVQNMFSALDRLNQGMSSIAISRALQTAQQNVDQVQATVSDEGERYNAQRQIANHLAMTMTQAGAHPDQIAASAGSIPTQPTAFEAAMREGAQRVAGEKAIEAQKSATQLGVAKIGAESRETVERLKEQLRIEQQKVPTSISSKLDPLKQLVNASDRLIDMANKNPEWFDAALGVKNYFGAEKLRSSGLLKKMTDTLGITDPKQADEFASFATQVNQYRTTYEQIHGGARAVASASIQPILQQNVPDITQQPNEFLQRVIASRNPAAQDYNDKLQETEEMGYRKAAQMTRLGAEHRSPADIMAGKPRSGGGLSTALPQAAPTQQPAQGNVIQGKSGLKYMRTE
jgi:hypothetical protein